MKRPMKRVVTGHDENGLAVITEEGEPATMVELAHIPGTVFYELWRTDTAPAPVDNGADPTVGPLRLSPDPSGTVFRIVDIPPDTEEFLTSGAAGMKDAFAEIGESHASTVESKSPHPLMHRTESVDYGIVLEGEVTLIVDRGESLLRPGDVVVQRGTNHAWANRSGKVARMAFILAHGKYDPAIKKQ